jgi:hypothetical protein
MNEQVYKSPGNTLPAACGYTAPMYSCQQFKNSLKIIEIIQKYTPYYPDFSKFPTSNTLCIFARILCRV